MASDALASASGLGDTARAFARDKAFSGTIVVAKGEKPLYAAAFGLRDHEKHLPVTLDTRFQVGSVSKWFTVLVALKLVDEGQLALDAPITTYLPAYPRAVGGAITVADVFSNMSGLEDRLPSSLINEPAMAASSLSAAQAVTRYAQGPLVTRPGTTFDYAHTNWVLAQALIEQITAKPLEASLKSILFEPLGLSGTGVTHGSFEHVPAAAIAYESNDAKSPRKLHIIPNFLIPTGTIYSNSADLVRLAHAVYQRPMFKPATMRAFTTVRYAPEAYALGGRIKHETLGGSQKTLAFEIGSFGGFKALLVHVIEDDISVVILNNTDMSEDDLTVLSDQLLTEAYR